MDSEIKGWIKFSIVTGLIIVGIMVVISMMPFTTVKAGQRGVVLRWGAVNRVLDAGVHWRTPISEEVFTVDVTTQKEQVKATAASKDLQTVSAEIALNFNLESDTIAITDLWNRFNDGSGNVDYKSRIIDPAIQESVKAATAKYTAEELITKRQQIKEDLKLSLAQRLKTDHIIVDEVSIVDFDFSLSFNQSIESKVKAEQDALTQKNRLEQFKYEAEQAVVKAKGEAEARVTNAKAEAEAIRIQAQAITQQGGAEYVNLKAVEKWDGNLPQQMIPGGAVPFINLNR